MLSAEPVFYGKVKGLSGRSFALDRRRFLLYNMIQRLEIPVKQIGRRKFDFASLITKTKFEGK